MVDSAGEPLIKHTCTTVISGQMDQQPPSGALRSFREISDFIPVVSSTAPHLTMTYVLIRGASPSVQKQTTAEQTKL